MKLAYKPLLLTTTVRNPARYKTLIDVILAFDGQVLTNVVIDKIMFELVARKIYIPMYGRQTDGLKEQLTFEDVRFSDDDTRTIIENSPQNHKEAGFDNGWASRFDTFYKFAKELGFVYYEMDKPIEVSETGVKLSKAIDPEFAHLEQQVFLNAFAKYERNNPFRRVLNANKPLILLLQTISELRKIYKNDCKGISRQEIPIILCWKDNNAVKLAKQIKKIRDKYGLKPSDDYIYEICLGLLESDNTERFKRVNIIKEMPDEFIRKMRLTGLISLRGNGHFIDFNSLEKQKIDYLLREYTELSTVYTTKRKYFNYMKLIDVNLVSIEALEITTENERERLLGVWVQHFGCDTLKDELKVVSNPKLNSHDPILKFINEPTRFEFLTAIALKKFYPILRVVPNYCIDDEGLPTSHAPGNGADIVCYDNYGNILFEVTLLTGTQQNIREMPAIIRHLGECVQKYPDSFSVMICPRVHSDTLKFAEFTKFKDNLDVIVIDTIAFINTLGRYKSAREYKY